MKAKRGEFGYITAKKRRSLFGLLLMALIGVSIFLIGLFLNGMSNRNIFTVIAVCFALPGAKFLVGFIITFPYHSVSEERYEKAKEILPEGTELLTDLVITSSEKVMHLDFVVIGNGQVIALLGNGKQELDYVRKYVAGGVHNWGPRYKVKIVENEKTFINEVMKIEQKEVDAEEQERVKSYFTAITV